MPTEPKASTSTRMSASSWDWAIWAGLGMFVIGLLMTAGAVIVILLIGRHASRD